MAIGLELWGWGQAVKVTPKQQGWTWSIPGPAQSLVQGESKSFGLLGVWARPRGWRCPSAGWESSYCPYFMGFHSLGEKMPLGQQVCLYITLSFQNFVKPFDAKLTLKCPTSGLCGLWQLWWNLLPFPGFEKPSVEDGAKPDHEFHAKLYVFLSVCLTSYGFFYGVVWFVRFLK